MLSRSSIPAIALKSVAFRYCHWSTGLIAPLASTGSVGFPQAGSDGPSLPEDTDAAKMQRIEAVLFLAREPLSSRKLSQYANLADGTEARTLVRRLNQ